MNSTTHPRPVLLAEDDPVSRLYITRVLESWGYQVVVARDGDEAWSLLQAPDAPLLAVLDWMMPGVDGIEICRRLKADPQRRHSYLVMLTASPTTADMVTALEAGADDFIAKPFRLEELRVRLRAGERIVELQRELHRKASHDDVVGLFNRRMVLELLAREYARAVREHIPLSVALLDLDYFKRVNDTFGHRGGDIVLHEVARRIETSIRQNDIVGRYGGEEFLLVMPGCHASAAADIAERVRKVVAATPVQAGEGSLTMTVSVGVVTATDLPIASSEGLIRDADRALYMAKRGGRNRVESSSYDAQPIDIPS